jgi:hypothetical protein
VILKVPELFAMGRTSSLRKLRMPTKMPKPSVKIWWMQVRRLSLDGVAPGSVTKSGTRHVEAQSWAGSRDSATHRHRTFQLPTVASKQVSFGAILALTTAYEEIHGISEQWRKCPGNPAAIFILPYCPASLRCATLSLPQSASLVNSVLFPHLIPHLRPVFAVPHSLLLNPEPSNPCLYHLRHAASGTHVWSICVGSLKQRVL